MFVDSSYNANDKLLQTKIKIFISINVKGRAT